MPFFLNLKSPHFYPEGSGFSLRILFFLANAFKRLVIRFSIHKPAGTGIPLHPAISFWIMNLAPVFYLAVPVSITSLSVLCHITML